MSTSSAWFRARSPRALGAALRRARESAGLSQEELASLTATSRPTVSRLERGANVSSVTVLEVVQECGYELVLVPRGARVRVEVVDAADTPEGDG